MVILVATSLSSVGLAMFDTGSAWMMTSLNPSPRLVSAVQVATTLPLFLLTLPAGALTDVVDPRRLLIVTQTVAVVDFGRVRGGGFGWACEPASLLLATSFLMGVVRRARGAGMAAHQHDPRAKDRTRQRDRDRHRGLQYRTRDRSGDRRICDREAQHRRSILVLRRRQSRRCLRRWSGGGSRRRPKETLPAERLISAMTAGVRYVRYSREMDATLIRAIAFFPFASAYLALLPLVARSQTATGRRSMAS